ncbi:uncharacterized protein [Linepithema humile]|uniref:uncharacterized protein n=1 Tax=Linepithema humile TaxID=83485 RepID=UPI00351F2C00
MDEDCLLGTDFLSKVNLENVFKPIFGNSVLKEEEEFVCSRIENYVDEVPQMLTKLSERESRNLNKDLLRYLSDRNQKIVAENCDIVEYVINVNNFNPIKQTPRRIPLRMREEVDKIIEDMKRQGVIEESRDTVVSRAKFTRSAQHRRKADRVSLRE